MRHKEETLTGFMNMIEFRKEEMNRSLKEIYVNTNKQWREIIQAVQYLKVEIESSQTVGNQEIKNLGA